MTFEEFKKELINMINTKGKDDVKFTVIGIHWAPNEHYYFDNCIKLDEPMDYAKGDRPIKAVLYDGDLQMIVRPSHGPKEIKEFSLSEEERIELLDRIRRA